MGLLARPRTARSGTPPPKPRTPLREPGAKPGRPRRSPLRRSIRRSSQACSLAIWEPGRRYPDARSPAGIRGAPEALEYVLERAEVAERRGTMPVGLTVTSQESRLARDSFFL